MDKCVTQPESNYFKKPFAKALFLIFVLISVLSLSACGKKRLAVVEERKTNGSRVSVDDNDGFSAVDAKLQTYQVKAGDTLYSIAFRFGLDYQTLAKANGINSNYLINVGQQLDIEAARNYQESTSSVVAITPRPKPVSKPRETTAQISTSKPQIKPVIIKPKPVVTNKPKPVSKPVAKPISNPARVVDSNNPVKFWIWPNMGSVTKGFIATGRKGIDISGNIGDPVRASASGRVVYAGRGLRGYGNLVIIKHNNSFISAYAHNRKILVKENEIIKAGQKIAEIGNSDTDLPKLHFEIRYKGKPTDPLKYLPKR